MRELCDEEAVFPISQRARAGVILDEAQAVPAVFAALRGILDADRRRRGALVLLGSAQPALVRGVAESLAGRGGVLELEPLTAAEAAAGPAPLPWPRPWLAGGLPQLGVDADPRFLRRLLTMLAHRQGGLLNVAALAGALGASHGRVSRALDLCEQTFLLRRLPPFFRNVGKRLTKSPKAYLRDTGMLHHLRDIASLDVLDAHPVRGASWENFIVEDLLRRERLAHPYGQAFFWRTAAGAEIDLLVRRGESMQLVEIKAGVGTARQARGLGDALADVGAHAGWILDQGGGIEVLSPREHRRAFAADVAWLPT